MNRPPFSNDLFCIVPNLLICIKITCFVISGGKIKAKMYVRASCFLTFYKRRRKNMDFESEYFV